MEALPATGAVMSRLIRFASVCLLSVLAASLVAVAVPPEEAKKDKAKKKASTSRDVDDALAQVRVEGGLKAEAWASEPLLANPVSFAFDEQGKCYVAETTRFGKGVPDTRSFMYWLDDDLACRTVADRLAMYKREYPGHKPYTGFEKYEDQLRVVWDSTGKGVADKSEIFSGGYNRPEDGLAAGVLARKGNVYFANIPDLYKLKDTNGDGKADVKQSLSTGYGVRAQFLGHDLHGLRMGPNGKLYFSIGDRGFTVKTKEGKTLSNPDSGAVLRCDPDGANLEIVHVGLRNPQELAFDDFGNLFTYDNNSDSGDRARWVQIVEGGDSGWRAGYQYGTAYHTPGVKQGNRGPWNTEGIWHLADDKELAPPAYVLPPLAHFGNGPAGITHYPGVGLSDRYKDHFFACDFTSNPGNSVIHSLAVKPKGASFEVVDRHDFVRGMVPTDCEFGPDGAFYWSDWVGGWSPPNKGRIFRVTDPEAMKTSVVAESQKLISEGMTKRSVEELAKLLGHPHQQIRLEAQFELAERVPNEAVQTFARAASAANTNRIARLHGIWGLGMVARKNPWVAQTIAVFTGDSDATIRASAVHVLPGVPSILFSPNDAKTRAEVLDKVDKLLSDADARVRAEALVAHAKLSNYALTLNPASEQARFEPVFELLKSNNDTDAYLRHGAVLALAELAGNPVDLWNAWTQSKEKFDHRAVRLGVLLALRRLHNDKCAEFLTDADAKIAIEAARAIHDERIEAALPALAAFTEKPGQPDAIAFRALSAAFKLGTPEQAARIANFAARPTEADHVRAFALKLLADWENPPRRDHITGLTVSLPARPAEIAAAALKQVIAKVFAGSDLVRSEAVKTVAKLSLKDVGPLMAAIVKDETRQAGMRVEALFALAALKDPAVKELTAIVLASPDARLRAAGRIVKAKSDPVSAAIELPKLLDDASATLVEKQAAFAALGSLGESKAADEALAGWLDRLKAGQVPTELKLDVLEAVSARTSQPKLKLHAPLGNKARAYDDANRSAAAKAPLVRYDDALAGGDADRGKQIVIANAAVYCQRCHRIDGQGGDVGPVLNGLAAQAGKDREYLLESIVMPTAKIAKGFETVNLTLADGRQISGIVKAEDKKQIRLITPENKEMVISVDDVEARRTGPSAMPDDLHKKLSRRELRDVVEFLASLKEPAKP